jgi:DNA-binding transcriptional ArsR family regulator
VIHAPARLRIMVTLAALRDGDDLSFTRLQELIGLTPGNLITHLRKLEDAGYVTAEKNGSGVTARTSVALTLTGRVALDSYKTTLRQLLDSASPRLLGRLDGKESVDSARRGLRQLRTVRRPALQDQGPHQPPR